MVNTTTVATEHHVRYISNLTPLRGIAALLVAVFHFEMAIARFIQPQYTLFFEKSYLMVDLFFVMSGFIMLHVYGNSFREQLSKANFKKFIIARFARIYPLHFFSLTLLIVMVLFLAGGHLPSSGVENAAAIPTNFLLLHSFYIHPIFTWNIPSWSISAEWWAYMVFPFAAIFLHRNKLWGVITMLLFILIAYFSITYLLPRKNPMYPSVPVPHNLNTTYDYGWLRGFAGFAAGMLLYLLYQVSAIRNFFSRNIIAFVSILAVAACLHFGIADIITIVAFALLILSFACNYSMVYRICSNAVLQYLGLISYSIYLMQIFLQEPFSRGLRLPGVTGFGRGRQNIAFASGLGYCIIYLLLLIGISTITYYLLETPCRRYINKRWG